MSDSAADKAPETGTLAALPETRINWAKVAIAVMFDLADFTIGRFLGFGMLFDAALALVAMALFGWKGLFQIWELADPTEQIDGFVPTLTLIALAHREPVRRRKSR